MKKSKVQAKFVESERTTRNAEKSFDSDINVSVFETNIRIVGGKPIQRLIIFIPATKFDIIFIRIA